MNLWWATARAGGLIAWLLVTASIVWGLALSTRVLRGRPRPSWILDLHRFLGALACVFTAIHVAAISFDSYVDFGLTDLLIPGASPTSTGAVAWGIVGAYLLGAVQITSMLRRRISKSTWRRVHQMSFGLFVVATQHALAAGTDAATLVVRIVAVIAVLGVTALTAVRAGRPDQPDRPRRAGSGHQHDLARGAAFEQVGDRSTGPVERSLLGSDRVQSAVTDRRDDLVDQHPVGVDVA
jgi:DMSO/TMAO reductase YedYZ heme-binding membrane subunit